MGIFSIILIVGGVVGVLVLLVMLYVMCKSCNSQAQREQDIENNRLRMKYPGEGGHEGQTLAQRRPHTHLITETQERARRPGHRGTEAEGGSVLSEGRSSGKRPLLHKAAIMKHIHPICNSDLDAIYFSTERDKKYPTEVNHVFKINPNEFTETGEYRELVGQPKLKTFYRFVD